MEQKMSNLSIHHTTTKRPVQTDFLMHTHQNYEFYYFIKGKGVFYIEGNNYPLKNGDILIMNSAESHYIKTDAEQPYERLVIHFSKEFVQSFDAKGELLSVFENKQPGKNNLFRKEAFSSNLYQMLINNIISDIENSIQVETNFLALLNELKNAHSKANLDKTENTLTNQIANYIIGNLENEFTLEDICREFYISKQYLCRIFKKSTGSTIWNYVTVKRLLRAKTLMELGVPPTSAYTKCGFSDYSCFYRAYKKYYGVSPKENKLNF